MCTQYFGDPNGEGFAKILKNNFLKVLGTVSTSESIRYSINPKNKWFLQKGNPIQNSKKANSAFNGIHINSWFQVDTNFSVLEIASGFSFSPSPSMLYTCSRRSWTLFSVFLAMNLKFFSLSWNDNSLQTSEWPVSVPTSTSTRGSL